MPGMYNMIFDKYKLSPNWLYQNTEPGTVYLHIYIPIWIVFYLFFNFANLLEENTSLFIKKVKCVFIFNHLYFLFL